jgi:hypothetical protein
MFERSGSDAIFTSGLDCDHRCYCAAVEPPHNAPVPSRSLQSIQTIQFSVKWSICIVCLVQWPCLLIT